MPDIQHATHLAHKPGKATDHIVTGVANFDPKDGLRSATAECGVKFVIIKAETASRESHPANTCKRCLHTLGWDL